ncbi:MAG: type I pullulanase [Spirochaetota bacterium]|jgi:type I pullulanase
MKNFINKLRYTIPAGTGRRIGWADQTGGYIDVWSDQCGKGAGYIRGSYCRLKDLVVCNSQGEPLSRHHGRISLVPGEFSIQIDEHTLDASLLLDSGAFWVRFTSNCGILLPKNGSAWKEKTEMVQEKLVHILYRDGERKQKQRKGSGEAIMPSHEAVALASSAPITIKESHGFGPVPEGYGLYTLSSTGTTEVYLAWDADPARACAAAAELLCQDGRSVHQSKIEEFFKAFSLHTSHDLFDQAVAWAAFSGWTLVTREYGLGIWAGLPWFRDNWGRDTFIALPGILLVTGQFKAAREIIATFAERQDQDPTSPNYGRIPNRWRSPLDVIFNTVDGTPWFIREVWEYVQYTGDRDFALDMKPFVDRALEADLARCDQYGFLTHKPADTWMDARIRGNAPWSERSNRAVEVQALFYTALRCGQRIARLAGDETRANSYREGAERLRTSFIKYFWYPEQGRLADRLLDPADPEACSSVEPDLRSRPNALLAITVPSLLPPDEALLPEAVQFQVLKDVYRELVYPYGVASLSQEDPYFHPYHDGYPLYHKDAAYHNGTIWGWNAGPAIQALLRFGYTDEAWTLQTELSRQIMKDAAFGTLSENLHALLQADGLPKHSGTFSQAWSVSEFVRVAMQDWLGIQFRLADGTILCSPRLPPLNWEGDEPVLLTGTLSFGKNSQLQVRLRKHDSLAGLSLLWTKHDGTDPDSLSVQFMLPEEKGIKVLSRELRPEQELCFEWPLTGLKREALNGASPQLPAFNQPSRVKNYLEQQILQGLYNKGPIESLRAWYDSKEFAQAFHTDEVLGASCNAYFTDFKLWAPTASEVELILWKSGSPAGNSAGSTSNSPATGAAGAAQTADTTSDRAAGNSAGSNSAGSTETKNTAKEGEQLEESPLAVHRMYRQGKGVWHIRLHGDFHGVYYTYKLRIHSLDRETIDPYAKSAGLNGKRGMILDPRRLEPEGWQRWVPPQLASPSDAVIWEAHIRDLTSHRSWQGPEDLRCTYLGAAYRGTRYNHTPAGFDYIRALGITHVQFLPIFDFVSVDEGRVRETEYRSLPQNGAFNWGYDPQNYMAPEGSYATNPADGACRVLELRRLVQALGEAGIGVVMDVVYNHVPDRRRSALEACVPGYYFRGRRDSGAGDDTASERYMFRKYMIDTLKWWLTTYKLSGFRFDLMGLHDVDTMEAIASELKKIKPDLLLYGEGWNMYGGNQEKGKGKKSRKARLEMASQLAVHKLPDYGMFNDAFRDGVKGSVFDATGPGWLHDGRNKESVKFGLLGAVHHHQVHNRDVSGTARGEPWTDRSCSSINYLEVHDNLTLFDKLQLVEPGRDIAYYSRLQRLALTLLLTSQGIPVLHAGMEFLRTKEVPEAWLRAGGIDKCVTDPVTKRQFCHDSYKAGDVLNGLDWERADRESATVNYVRYLIKLRKNRPAFRLDSGAAIRRAISFVADSEGLLAWQIDERLAGAGLATVLIAANSRKEPVQLTLPGGRWRLLASSATAETWDKGGGPELSGHITIPEKSAMILELCP